MKIKSKDIAARTGLKLLHLRKEAGLSKVEMARILDVTPNAYRKNEQGFSIPAPNALNKLIGYFGISMDWFLFDRGPKLFEHRVNIEEDEEQITQLEQQHREQLKDLQEQMEKEQEENSKELQSQLQLASLKLREKEQEALITGEQAYLPDDVREMTEAMKKIPLLHYEILSHFHRFKKDNNDLFADFNTARG